MKKILKRYFVALFLGIGVIFFSTIVSADSAGIHKDEFSQAQIEQALAMLPEDIKTAKSEYEKVQKIKDFFFKGRLTNEEVFHDFHLLINDDLCKSWCRVYASLFYLFAKTVGIDVTIEYGAENACFNTVKIDRNVYCLDLAGYQKSKVKNDEKWMKCCSDLKGYIKFCCGDFNHYIDSGKDTPEVPADYSRSKQHAWLIENGELEYSEVEEAKKHLASVFSASGNKTEHQKVLAIRDYLAKDAKYCLDQSNMITFLQNKKGNCNAFARAFYALAKLASLKVTIDYGRDHAFNTVKVGKHWYCMDVCWYAVAEISILGSEKVKIKKQLPEWSLGSYEKFLKYDQKESHNILKSKYNVYNKEAREKFVRENCIYDNLEENKEDHSRF
ncbi:MAG: transglutaminase-like domain-containing protein, partial [Lactobacillales bacterium]|nr:transglutaminase-like domain-containing protein [Lactobacillales bacterium]